MGELEPSTHTWDNPSLLQTLEELTKKCQSEEYRRAELSKNVFEDLSVILENACRENEIVCKPTPQDLRVLAEVFRFLRNSVANCKENQDKVRTKTKLISICLDFLGESGKKVTELTGVSEDFYIAVRCCLQAIGNLLVDNPESCVIVKSHMERCIFPLFRGTDDSKSVQYSAMIIHLVQKVIPDFMLEIDTSVISKLLENTSLEFVVFVLESLAVSEEFTRLKYTQLDPERRVRFINFLIAHEEIYVRCSQSIIEFYGNQFETKSDLILKSKIQDDVWTCWEISCLLELLCCITAENEQRDVSEMSNVSLLTTSVCLLKGVHTLGKENVDSENAHAPIHKLEALRVSEDTEDMRSQPTFQFKAHLIRLIANLVHRDFRNQELVRDLEGLPIIMDCCQIDARNPFITQWAVLAIRNLCEGNTANQEFIDKVQKIDTENAGKRSDIKLVGL